MALFCTAMKKLFIFFIFPFRKLDLTDKIKSHFFPSSSRVDTDVWMHYMDLTKRIEKKLSSFTQKCCEMY